MLCITGAVSIPCQGLSPEFFQWPSHSPSEVNVDAADHGSTVDKGSDVSLVSSFRG